jgi:hypothetical protein
MPWQFLLMMSMLSILSMKSVLWFPARLIDTMPFEMDQDEKRNALVGRHLHANAEHKLLKRTRRRRRRRARREDCTFGYTFRRRRQGLLQTV